MSRPFAVRETAVAPAWQAKVALSLFILAMVSPLLVPLIAATDLPRELKPPLAGLMLFGLPMALMLIVVGLVGQPAFAFIKHRVVRQDAPPAAVSVTRYRIGAVLVIIAMLVSWIEPLVSPNIPEIAARRVLIGSLADALMLIGLFVLGGQFWDKLHALFVYSARVVPDPSTSGAAATAEGVQVNWRFYAGVALILCTALSWVLIPLAVAAGWSTARVASLWGGIVIANKVILVAAIAVMGKPGFNYLKMLLFGAIRKWGPPQQVSRRRYRLGLILVMVPLLMTWIAPYITSTVTPGSVYGYLQEASLVVLLLIGLFVLGGEFWDKLRALFQHRAAVEFA